MFYCYSNSPTGDQVFCLYNIYSSNNVILSQFHNHVQALKVNNSSGPLDNQTWYANGWPQQNLLKFSYTHNSTLANLSAKFDHPVACQNISLLAAVKDCESGLC